MKFPDIKFLRYFVKIRDIKVLRVIIKTLVGFYKDDGFTFAAGISFYFLLSFIPFIILMSSLIGYIVEYIQVIHKLSANEMATQAINSIKTAIPYIDKNMLVSFFSIKQYRGSLGTIGGLSLLVSATLLFSTLHYAFYRVFGGKYVNFLLSRLLGVVFLITITLLMFFIHYFSILFSSVMGFFKPYVPEIILNLFYSGNSFYSYFLTTIVIFFLFNILIYLFTVGIKRRFFPILAGSLLFSILWTLAKHFFNFYIKDLSNMNVVYGSATWVATVILWIYYSVILLLLSMEFIKVLTEEHFLEKIEQKFEKEKR